MHGVSLQANQPKPQLQTSHQVSIQGLTALVASERVTGFPAFLPALTLPCALNNEHLCPMRRHKRLKYMQAVRSSSQRVRLNKSWCHMHEVGRSSKQWIKRN